MKNYKVLFNRLVTVLIIVAFILTSTPMNVAALDTVEKEDSFEKLEISEEILEEEPDVVIVDEDYYEDDYEAEEFEEDFEYDEEYYDDIESTSEEEILGEYNIVNGGESTVGEQIVTAARKYVGVLPYVSGGTSLTKGADCSGLICSLYEYFGINLWSCRTKLQNIDSKEGVAIATSNIDKAEPGDIIKL